MCTDMCIGMCVACIGFFSGPGMANMSNQVSLDTCIDMDARMCRAAYADLCTERFVRLHACMFMDPCSSMAYYLWHISHGILVMARMFMDPCSSVHRIVDDLSAAERIFFLYLLGMPTANAEGLSRCEGT